MSEPTYVLVERALVDWFDASGFTTELVDGEWQVIDYTDDDSTMSITGMALAATRAILISHDT
jgi:hypothetical protein